MTEIKVDIYGNETEISSFTPGSTELLLRFSEPISGFLNVADKSFAVSEGKCIIKLNMLRDGEFLPKFVACDRILRLPKLIKDGNVIFPEECDDAFIRSLSSRERALEGRIKELEETVAQLTKSVYGTTLFN